MKKKKTLQVDNDGKTVRDFIFISDISKGIELILNYDGDKEIFNISSGKGTKLESVINIFKQLGISPAIDLLPVKQKDESILSNQLSKDILKFTEIINIEEGATMYYKYLKKENII